MWRRLREALAGLACVVLGSCYFCLLLLANLGRRFARMPDPFASSGRGARYGMRVMAPARLLPRRTLAITFGKYIFCKHRDPGPDVLRHEFMHSLQYRLYGFFGFLWRYGVDIARYGYADSSLETAARLTEHQGP